MTKKHKLTIRPDGQTLEVSEGKDLLSALKEASLFIKSSCGGHATCADCVVKILSGEDHLSPPPFEELKLLGNVFHLTKERLACQTQIHGDVSIDIGRHNKHDMEKVSLSKSKSKTFLKKKTMGTSEVKTTPKETIKDSEGQLPKRLDGGKRPKFFNTDKVDYSKNTYSRPLPAHKLQKKLDLDLPKESTNEKLSEDSKKSSKEFKKFRS